MIAAARRVKLRDDLNRLATEYNTAAKARPAQTAVLKRQACQLRLAAAMVLNGSYDELTGQSWLEAGRINLHRRTL